MSTSPAVTVQSRRWLALVLMLYLALAVLYAVRVPAWQAPDEPAHYNYIAEVATTGRLPVLRMGDYDGAYIQRLTTERFPPELSVAPLRYEAHQPPLYYLLAALVYRATDGALLPLRLLSVALGALLVVLIYALARLILPGRPEVALAAAAFTAFLPMHVATSAAVNNDALAEVVLAAILLLSVRYVQLALVGPRPPTPGDALAIGLLLGLALVTKVSAYVAIPVVLLLPLIPWLERRRGARAATGDRSPVAGDQSSVIGDRSSVAGDQPPLPGGRPSASVHRSPFTAYPLLLAPALLIALPWYVRNALVYGNLDILGRRWHDAVVVGQLTTAELASQAGWAAVVERFLVWTHSSFWGVFGWMGVWMDARIYTATLAFALAVAAGCAWQVHGCRRPADERWSVADHRRFQRWSLALLGLAALGTLGIYISYNLIFVQPQGRYLFPALPAISLAFAAGWWAVVQRPTAARWAATVLAAAALAAGLWGIGRGGVNKWSLLIFGGAAIALMAWRWAAARLEPPNAPGRLLAMLVYAAPFAAMAGLSLFALLAFVLPQLT
ncbi:MAG: glycosyltransferase family 39 protein [Caldilineales bacterium]|nr:glycosyltransferase family 39 protein [Caldilineales bacterium]MDW8318143.1 glycosyltransferase family 39 protein [Anaerolineae bacterium]